MLPFQLLFYPAAIFRNYPVRDWRRITVWLKWGLLIPFLAVILRLVFFEPAEASSIIRLFQYFASESEFAIPPAVRYGSFLIIEGVILLLAWLLRSGMIYLFYRLTSPSFDEGEIALSVGAASMVTGIWYLVPYGYIIEFVHCLGLTSYLLVHINRINFPSAVPVAILPALVPLLF